MPFEWSSDVGLADWWTRVLHPFAQDVGSVVPDVFPAYARVLHPVGGAASGRTWSEIAAENGRIAHAEMQLHEISRPLAAPRESADEIDYEQGLGSLRRPDLEALAEILIRHTTTPERGWFCTWEGYAQLHGGSAMSGLSASGSGGQFEGIVPREMRNGPQVVTPDRTYYLLSGPLSKIGDLYVLLWGQEPNVWWPDDRAWIVATEIYFGWTYIAGSFETIDEVLADPRLEAFRAEPTHKFTYDSDTLNAGLDNAGS